jgi:fatty-acid desaturase
MLLEYFLILLLGFVWYQIIAMFGLSIGIHRKFSHNQFETPIWFEVLALYLAVLAGSRSPLGWIGAHRMHHRYSDTEKDPHSPTYKGFWNVLINNWNIKQIPRRYVKDLYKNPRIVFFHNHWFKLHIATAIITLLISVQLFIVFVLSPLILGYMSYGLFNALGHKNNKPVYNWLIGILSAGESHHNIHHENPSQIQLSKYDFAGLIAKKLFAQ